MNKAIVIIVLFISCHSICAAQDAAGQQSRPTTQGLSEAVKCLDETAPPASACIDKSLMAQRRAVLDQEVMSLYSSWSSCNLYNLWEVVARCPLEARVGRLGDGGKWLCNPKRLLNKPSCVIYSFGSNGDTSFEDAIHAMLPSCQVHVFDPTPGLKTTSNEWMT